MSGPKKKRKTAMEVAEEKWALKREQGGPVADACGLAAEHRPSWSMDEDGVDMIRTARQKLDEFVLAMEDLRDIDSPEETAHFDPLMTRLRVIRDLVRAALDNQTGVTP